MAEKPTVVILCGGEGRRFAEDIAKESEDHKLGFNSKKLGELSRLPKVLAPIGGTPLLEHVMRSFGLQGFWDFTLLVGHQSDKVRAHLARDEFMGWNIHFHNTNTLNQAILDYLVDSRGKLGETIIVANGDALSNTDMTQFLKQHREQGSLLSINALGHGFKPFAGIALIEPQLLDPHLNENLHEFLSTTPPITPNVRSMDGGYYEFIKRNAGWIFDNVQHLSYVRKLVDYGDVTRIWNEGKAAWTGAYYKRMPDHLPQAEVDRLAREMPQLTQRMKLKEGLK